MVALYLHTASHTQTDYTPHNCMNTKWLQLPVGSFYRLSLWETIQRMWQFVTNTTSSTTNHQTIEMLNDVRLTEAPVVKAHEQMQGLFLVSYGDSLYQIKKLQRLLYQLGDKPMLFSLSAHIIVTPAYIQCHWCRKKGEGKIFHSPSLHHPSSEVIQYCSTILRVIHNMAKDFKRNQKSYTHWWLG